MFAKHRKSYEGCFYQAFKKLKRDLNKLLKLIKPRYGLFESADYWRGIFTCHLEKDLHMTSCILNAVSLFKKNSRALRWSMRTYVDDTFQAESEGNFKLIEEIERKFKCKPKQFDNMEFVGVKVETKSDFIILHQRSYILKQKILHSVLSYACFRSPRAQLSKTSNKLPDNFFAIARLLKVTEDYFENNRRLNIKTANQVVHNLGNNIYIVFYYLKPDKAFLSIQVCLNACFVNNNYLSSHVGHIIFVSN